VTTPGGVSNLPAGALTVDNMADKLQDMTPAAMRDRAAERMPGAFSNSNGGNPLADLTPFGILTRLFAGFNSHVANADPADINGPEDLPGLLLDFIHELPVVGQFVDLLDAIGGHYTGTDPNLLGIQNLFAGVRGDLNGLRIFIEKLIGQALDLLHLPTPEQAWHQIMTTFLDPLAWLRNIPIGSISSSTPNLLTNFISADSFVGETMWVFDDAVKPSGAPGSVRTVIDGTVHELISERIALDVGRKVNASVRIAYAALSAPAGSQIRLSWIGWSGDTEVAGGDFAVHQPTSAAKDWTTINGSLTRQESDLWDSVSIRLAVTPLPSATEGTVWFALPRATKPDLLPQNLVSGLTDALAKAGQSIRDAICNALGIGGTGHTDADVIHALTNIPQAAVAGIKAFVDDAGDAFKAIWNGWFGSGGTGSPQQVQYAIETIKDTVLNGYTVHTATASETNWIVPQHIECIGIMTGGGQNGKNGVTNSGPGGDGGLGGSFLAQAVDLTGVTALDIAVGTAGNKSIVRVANATPHTGAVVMQSPDHGSPGGIAGPFGYTGTTSTPGDGGKGGNYPSGGGETGTSSFAGLGGTQGRAGGSVSPGAATKCGGGGGGGGKGAINAFSPAGSGGNGGYPGGGGGGGGGVYANAGGPGGAGAPGVVWILTR